jgi:hypothetical protein
MLVVMLLPAIVAVALILVRGSSDRLAHIRIRAWWLIIPAAVLQWINSEGHYPPSVGVEAATRVVTAICLVLLAVLCWLNWATRGRTVRVGLGLVFAGTVANALPILAYGGMPYSTSAALTSGFSRDQLTERANGHIPIESDHATLLVALSDLVPIPGLMKVVSVGDIALVVGLVVMLVGLAGLRRPPRPRLAAEPLLTQESSSLSPPRPPAMHPSSRGGES